MTPAEFRRSVRLSRELARRCEIRAGELPAHVSTANVARDMDLLRQAVGDAKLSYAGYSYGTYHGATYANLFPRRVRALVLDAVIDAPAYRSGSQPSTTFVRQNSDIGSSETLNQFFVLCAEAGSRCEFAVGGAPRAKFARLAHRLRQAPLTNPSGAGFGYAELVTVTVLGLYSPAVWAPLASLLQQLYALTRPKQAVRDLRALARSATLAP
jgi:pimeloyl-ACP methyl ester carboxylesterase